MNKAQIDASYRLENSVVVSYDDGMNLYFDWANLSKAPAVVGIGSEPTPEVVAYRTMVARIVAGTVVN